MECFFFLISHVLFPLFQFPSGTHLDARMSTLNKYVHPQAVLTSASPSQGSVQDDPGKLGTLYCCSGGLCSACQFRLICLDVMIPPLTGSFERGVPFIHPSLQIYRWMDGVFVVELGSGCLNGRFGKPASQSLKPETGRNEAEYVWVEPNPRLVLSDVLLASPILTCCCLFVFLQHNDWSL